MQGEVDGIEAAEVIREKWDIPVVFITAYAETSRLKRAKLAYPFGYILKPFDPQSLKITVEMAIYVARIDRERRETEERLKGTEKRLRLALDSVRAGVWEWNIDTDRVHWDNRMYEIYSLEPGSLNGALGEWRRFVHPDDVQKDEEASRQALQTGGRYELEYRVRGPGNDWRHISSSAVVLLDDNGRPQRMAGIALDITERKKAEEALKKEENLRRILVDQSRDGIVVIDQDGKVYDANQKYADMLGCTAEEVKQLYVWDWDTQWTSQELLTMIRDVDEKGDHFVTRHRRRDGTMYDVEISTNGAIYEGRKMVLCVCRDITQRKVAEEELRKSEVRFRELFNSINELVYIQDLEGRFLSVNPAMQKFIGYKADELVGSSASDYMKPENRNLFERDYLEKIKKEGHLEGVICYLKKDGRKVYFEYVSKLVMPEIGDPYISGMGRDVTELVLAKREIKRLTEKLENGD